MKKIIITVLTISISILVIVALYIGVSTFRNNTSEIDTQIQIYSEDQAIKVIQDNYSDVKNVNRCNGFNCNSNIRTKYLEVNSTWKVEFYQGSGDCPAGCINSHYWYFTINSSGKISKEGEYSRTFNSRINAYDETGKPNFEFIIE